MGTDNEPPLYRVTFAFLGAIIGGFIVWLMSTRELHVVPVGVSYGDLAAIALTASTVVLAVLALLIAIAAIYGYREFMKRSAAVAAEKAREVAEPIATAEVRAYLSTNLTPIFEERAKTVAAQLLTPAVLRELIIQQVNEIQAGNTRDDLLDVEAAADAVDELEALDAEAALDEEAEEEGE